MFERLTTGCARFTGRPAIALSTLLALVGVGAFTSGNDALIGLMRKGEQEIEALRQNVAGEVAEPTAKLTIGRSPDDGERPGWSQNSRFREGRTDTESTTSERVLSVSRRSRRGLYGAVGDPAALVVKG